jgi:hypothetical protein
VDNSDLQSSFGEAKDRVFGPDGVRDAILKHVRARALAWGRSEGEIAELEAELVPILARIKSAVSGPAGDGL